MDSDFFEHEAEREDAELASIYKRFAEANINVLSVTESVAEEMVVAIIVEYLYRRDSDGKPSWAKAAFDGCSLPQILRRAERVVKLVRGE